MAHNYRVVVYAEDEYGDLDRLEDWEVSRNVDVADLVNAVWDAVASVDVADDAPRRTAPRSGTANAGRRVSAKPKSGSRMAKAPARKTPARSSKPRSKGRRRPWPRVPSA